VVARSLHIEDEKYNEVGESLLIPEDYKGIIFASYMFKMLS
jgi:hypothetical protein